MEGVVSTLSPPDSSSVCVDEESSFWTDATCKAPSFCCPPSIPLLNAEEGTSSICSLCCSPSTLSRNAEEGATSPITLFSGLDTASGDSSDSGRTAPFKCNFSLTTDSPHVLHIKRGYEMKRYHRSHTAIHHFVSNKLVSGIQFQIGDAAYELPAIQPTTNRRK